MAFNLLWFYLIIKSLSILVGIQQHTIQHYTLVVVIVVVERTD